MPGDLTYDVAFAEKAQSIDDALTDDGYRAYPNSRNTSWSVTGSTRRMSLRLGLYCEVDSLGAAGGLR